MFEQAYKNGYAIGAFNVNNMEIVQGITEACKEENAPVILQVSKGARAYANHTYLVKLVEAAVIDCFTPRPRSRFRNLQSLHRRRLYFGYDRRLLSPLRRERRFNQKGR